MRPRRPQPATVLAGIALLVALSGTSLAAGGGSIAGGGSPPAAAGPASCPPRATRVAGLCFDSAPRGPVAGVRAAADACAVAGGYLPTAAELRAASAGLQLGDGRAAHSQFTDSYHPGARGRLATTTVVDEAGSRRVVDENRVTGRVKAHFEYTCFYPAAG
jgi:hypothetical protein